MTKALCIDKNLSTQEEDRRACLLALTLTGKFFYRVQTSGIQASLLGIPIKIENKLIHPA